MQPNSIVVEHLVHQNHRTRKTQNQNFALQFTELFRFVFLFAGHHGTKNASSYPNHIDKQVKSGKLQFLNQHVDTVISWNSFAGIKTLLHCEN